MKRIHVFGIVAVACLVGLLFFSVGSPNRSQREGLQYVEVIASPALDLEVLEQRELLTLTIQKLSTFGVVRSALQNEISIPEFVKAGANTVLLLAQRQAGTWGDGMRMSMMCVHACSTSRGAA